MSTENDLANGIAGPTDVEGAANLLARAKAVVFDVDGTLYRQGPVRLQMARRMFAHAAASLDLQMLRVIWEFRRERERLAEASPEGFMQPLYETTAERVGVSIERVEEITSTWIEERPLDLLRAARVDGALELFAALRANGKRLAVLSDYPAAKKLAALELEAEALVSATDPDVDALKPHPRGLQRILDLLGYSASEVVVIGDRVERDGAVALALDAPFVIRSSKKASDSSRSSSHGFPIVSDFRGLSVEFAAAVRRL
ncbi:MAG: HAD family hydrolase [Pseudomonadota bacterium]